MRTNGRRRFVWVIAVTVGLLTVVVGVGAEVRSGSKLILVMIDGLAKWMLDDPRLSEEDLKGFQLLKTHGTSAKHVQPEFPTLSLPNHQTVLTGLHVENHGVIADYMYDANSQLHFRKFSQSSDTDLVWWNESEPIWVTAQKQGVRTAVHWWRGCKVQFPGAPSSCDVADDPLATNADSLNKKMRDVVENLRNDDVNFVLLDYDRIENIARRKGVQSGDTLDEIRRLSDTLQQLQKMLSVYDLWTTTNVIVVSDHGMADVPLETNWFFIDDFVDMDSIETVVNSGAFMMVYPRKGHEHQVHKDLSSTMPNVKVYWKEDLNSRWRLKNAKHLPPIIVVSEMPYGIYCRTREKLVPNAPKNAPADEILPKSLNGFDNNEEKMWAMFYGRGPDFRQNYSVPLLRLVDVYQIVCNIFELKCHAHNGSWNLAMQMLTRPVSSTILTNDKHIPSSYDSLSSNQSGRLIPNLLSGFLFGLLTAILLLFRFVVLL